MKLLFVSPFFREYECDYGKTCNTDPITKQEVPIYTRFTPENAPF